MCDKLVKILVIDLPKLRDLYKLDWPNNIIGYSTIDNYINWLQKDPHINHLHIFSLNGDWSDGTYVVVDRYQLLINTLNKSNDRLKIAMSLVDWNRGYLISCFSDKFYGMVTEMLTTNNMSQPDHPTLTAVYYLSHEKAAKFDVNLPDGITLNKLKQEDAITADAVWPHKTNGTQFLLERLLAWNPNIGAYDKNGKLASWCFKLQGGALGALQTDVSYKRKGLGEVVLRAISKQLAEHKIDTFACIFNENIPSINLFKKNGFEFIFDVHWIWTYPNDNLNWRWNFD